MREQRKRLNAGKAIVAKSPVMTEGMLTRKKVYICRARASAGVLTCLKVSPAPFSAAVCDNETATFSRNVYCWVPSLWLVEECKRVELTPTDLVRSARDTLAAYWAEWIVCGSVVGANADAMNRHSAVMAAARHQYWGDFIFQNDSSEEAEKWVQRSVLSYWGSGAMQTVDRLTEMIGNRGQWMSPKPMSSLTTSQILKCIEFKFQIYSKIQKRFFSGVVLAYKAFSTFDHKKANNHSNTMGVTKQVLRAGDGKTFPKSGVSKLRQLFSGSRHSE